MLLSHLGWEDAQGGERLGDRKTNRLAYVFNSVLSGNQEARLKINL